MKLELINYMLERIEKISEQFGGVKSRVRFQIESDKHCKNQYEAMKNSYSRINCNDDVESFVNRIKNMINQYSVMLDNDKKLFPVDFFSLDLTILNCIMALEKAARNLDNSRCNFKYNQQDIDTIFSQLDICAEQLSSLSLRSACQD